MDDRMPTVTPVKAAELLRTGEASLVDVREDFELALASVAGALHVPLSQIPARWKEIPTDRPVVVLCHHGVRSAAAARWLRAHGVDAWNLAGGIDAWARDVDASVGAY